MSEIPVLVLAFNRPESVSRVFTALSQLKPANLLFSVDGPRPGNHQDALNVKAVQETVELINWNTNLDTRFRENNLGLRFAVPDAVTWAVEKFGKVIVLEDDAIPGPDFLSYMNSSLVHFENDLSVGHVSGYNQVPSQFITTPGQMHRKSIYPESYAWGTWERAWKFYRDDLDLNIEEFLSSKFSKIVWRENFNLAKLDLISTWAFRWTAALWQNDLMCISPNVNLVDYVGHVGGTHTRRKPRASEQPIGSTLNLDVTKITNLDTVADNWTSKHIFRETPRGIVDIKIARIALGLLKKYAN